MLRRGRYGIRRPLVAFQITKPMIAVLKISSECPHKYLKFKQKTKKCREILTQRAGCFLMLIIPVGLWRIYHFRPTPKSSSKTQIPKKIQKGLKKKNAPSSVHS